MKKFLLMLLGLTLVACSPQADEMLSDPNSNVEVIRHYYDGYSYVYIARFKDQPNVVTTTFNEGKVQRGLVTIYENDSIIVQRKQ